MLLPSLVSTLASGETERLTITILALVASTHNNDATEAKDHHRPGGGLRHCRDRSKHERLRRVGRGI